MKSARITARATGIWSYASRLDRSFVRGKASWT